MSDSPLAPAIEITDVNDYQQVADLAKKSAVMITTVGPYCQFGETVFKACAETGTHYLDCTGEFPWVHAMIKKYEKTAQESGAIMFPQIGIESAPPDLCTWALAGLLREEMGAKTGEVTINVYTLE